MKAASLGELLVDDRGFTLYTFALDKNGVSACTGSCATTWPPFTTPAGGPPLSRVHLTGRLGTILRAEGAEQVTFNGRPLYVFSGDAQPGQTNGQGVLGLWSVVDLRAAGIVASAAPNPPPAGGITTPTPPAPTAPSTNPGSAIAPPVGPVATSARPVPTLPPPRSSWPASMPPPSMPPPSMPPPSMPPQPTNCIPQGGGGDHDADNSGGPSDGDGCT